MSNPITVRDKALAEAYELYDSEIGPLPKTAAGKIDTFAKGYEDNQVDAVRHAYVSGVFAMEFGASTAAVLGWINEYIPAGALPKVDAWIFGTIAWAREI